MTLENDTGRLPASTNPSYRKVRPTVREEGLMEQGSISVGIEVDLVCVDMAIHSGQDRCEVANDEASIAALVAQMLALNPAAFGSASRALELPLTATLADAS